MTRSTIIERGKNRLIVNSLSINEIAVMVDCGGGGHTILLTPLQASELACDLAGRLKAMGASGAAR